MDITIDDETGQTIIYSPVFDYMSCGKTQEEALKHFEDGLYATLQERIKWGQAPIPSDGPIK